MFHRLILFIACTPLLTLAQNNFIISGHVFEEATQQSLQGANIIIKNTSIGSTTDRNGYFRIRPLPRGKYILEVSYIGYSTFTKELKLLNSDTTLTIQLSQSPISGPLVTVTATQARERLSPVSFSNIERTDIEARYAIQDIPEVISELPSTTFYSENGNGLGYNYVSIRGFDQRRISVLINGIPQNDPEDHNVYWLDFPDFASNVQTIQVQRGAGTAFYGPAAIGGSINLQTNYFSPEPKLKLFYGFGSYNTRKYALSYNTGLLWDKLVVYAHTSRIQSDGYRQRAWINFWSYFVGMALYTQNHSLRFHFYGGPIEDGLAYTGLPKLVNQHESLRRKNYSYWETNAAGDSITYRVARRNDEIENFNQPHLEILQEYRLNTNISLRSNLFFIHGYGFFDYDGSWAPAEYFRLTPEYGYDIKAIPENTLIRAYVDNQQVGWLPQMAWTTGWGELVVGAELRLHRSLHWGRLQKGSELPDDIVGAGGRHYYEYKGAKNIASFYIHQTSELGEHLYLTSDLQYAYKKYRLYNEKYLGNEFEVPYHFLNPRVGMNYNLSSNWNAYVSITSTSREPRLKNLYDAAEASTPSSWGTVAPQFEVNADGSYNFDKPFVKPETLTGLEIGTGYQSAWLRGTMNYYYMDFRNEIIKKGRVDRFGQPITGNAKQTLHQGIELSAQIQISAQFSLNANWMLGSNQLISYTVYDSDGNLIVLDGNPIAGFPNTLANIRFSYAWQNTYAALELRYSGKFYTDNFKNKQNRVDAHSVFNLNLRQKLDFIGMDGFILQGRINNLLDQKYLAHGEGADFFPAATRNGFINLQYEW